MQHAPLYILRHGQTIWNAEQRFQGRLDSPLTPRGIAQAAAQRKLLEQCDLTGFEAVSSPQGRAFHTAALALVGLVPRIETDARLSEIGIGAWEGRLRAELDPDGAHDESEESALSLYETAPGGEGFSALHARCRAFLEELRGPAVIVTHGITSRMLRAILLNLGIGNLDQLPGGQGVVFRVENGRQTKLSIRA